MLIRVPLRRVDTSLAQNQFTETQQSSSVQCVTNEVYGILWITAGGYVSNNVTYNYGALLNQPVINQLLGAGPTKGA